MMEQATASLLLWQSRILPPADAGSYLDLALRWLHIASGIVWIGLLYFFNLVATPALARLEPPVRGKVILGMLPKALAWFRWTAVGTVAAGFAYWLVLFTRDVRRQNGQPDPFLIAVSVFDWFLVVGLAWIANFLLLRVPAVEKSGYAYGAVVLLLAGWIFYEVVFKAMPDASNRVLSIGVGGAYGLFLLLNVWGIVWPAQKRLLAWMKENPGAPPPPELARRMRQALLVSRASFWLTFPILFFMAAASHFPIFSGH